MKKGWKITIAAAVIAVLAIVVVAVAGKTDKRVEALKGMQSFFQISKESEFNHYLDYCSFADMFYKKDMQVSTSLYTDIARITAKAEMEGTVDKSGRMIKMTGNVGLGGIPFSEFDLYSDDTNLYLASEVFKDKILKLNYTEDLYDVGSKYGISRTEMTILQKGYIQLFQMAVSQSEYEKGRELLKKKQLSKDLIQIYDHMKVEKQKNPDELQGGYVYLVNLPAEDVKLFLQDLCLEYPEFEDNGYLDIVNKFVSDEKGVEITEVINEKGFTSELSVKNAESGYELALRRSEQEKEEQSGFESSFSMTVTKEGNGLFNGEIAFDYSDTDGTFQIEAREDHSRVSAVVSGMVNADSKKGKITINTEEIQVEWGNKNFELYGNAEIVFGDYSIQLPEGTNIDVIHGAPEELRELKADILQNLKGIVGSAFKQFLGSIGFNF